MESISSSNNNTGELDALDKHEIEQKKKKRFAIIGAASILVVVVGGVALFNTGTINSISNPFSKETVNEQDYLHGENLDPEKVLEKEEEVSLVTSSLPIELPDYLNTQYNPANPNLRNELLNRYMVTDLSIQTAPLNSEASGYHMGGPMDDYQVSITREEVIASTGEYIERLVNPTFGNWSEAQYSTGNANEDFPIENIADMFSLRFLNSNLEKNYSEYLPVYADWNSDNYGRDDLSNVYRWHGELTGLESKIENDSSGVLDVNVVANVLFTSWDNNGEKVTKPGVLELHLIRGGENERPVVIDDANLTIT